MDETDRKILRLLQRDASTPLAEIARQVKLSKTPCWNRIKKMEAQGIIQGRIALVAADKVGLGVTVFVALRTDRHEPDWMQRFAAASREMPEIMEVYRLAGTIDYLLKVVVKDMAAYDDFYRRLTEKVPLFDVNSMIAMERIKSATCLPI